MQSITVIFFGSTSDSEIVLSKLYSFSNVNLHLTIACVVTQPPRPSGRNLQITPTPVETWAKTNNIPVVSFASHPQKSWQYQNKESVVATLEPFKADLLVSASYGQKIPTQLIKNAQFGGLNVHPSLLPRWKGADPVPWALLAGDHQIGVTVVSLEEQFDKGKIISQKKIPITNNLPDPLRTKLFTIGANLLNDILPDYISGTNKGHVQNMSASAYARRFTRNDGFIPWDIIKAVLDSQDVPNTKFPPLFSQLKSENKVPFARLIEQASRALFPWPGLWTTIMINNLQKRVKILGVSLTPSSNNQDEQLTLDLLQMEGKKPVTFKQFREAYLT